MNRDKISELYAGLLFSPETQLAARDRINWICRQAQGEKILDIGCSQGIVCLILGREGFSCTGVDIEYEAIEFAKGELEKEADITKERVVFQVGDATNLEFDDNSFDTVILGEIIEHLTHPEKVLLEAKRVLKEDGLIIITTPLGLNSHFDHKKTYFPLSFLETVRPIFNTVFVDTLHNYIIYVGLNETDYDPSLVPDKVLLNEIINIGKKTEERWISQEIRFEQFSQSLIEKGKKYQEQVDSLIQDRNTILANNTAIQENLQAQVNSLIQERDTILTSSTTMQQDAQKQIDSLTYERSSIHSKLSVLQNEMNKKVTNLKDLEEKVVSVENDLKTQTESAINALAYQESVFRHSNRWRLGSVFIGGIRILYDLIIHPIRFSKEAGKRFKDYYRDIMPYPYEMTEKVELDNPEKVELKLPEMVELKLPESNTTTIIPPLGTYGNVFTENRDADSVPTAIACILDEFTFNCVKPELNLITFRPDNWKEVLGKEKLKAIFVESAWHGNEGSWQYKIASYQKNMGDELQEIINWTKNAGVPSIFWNKEDPPHYDRFIEKAKLFDYVFTSDENCVTSYKTDLGHPRVYSLPFAAQPVIHNPILKKPRENNVGFAGTYYGAIYPERQKDMDILLKPALEFGLHIYDRQYGMVGPGMEHYRFPDLYKDAIKGRLEYVEMVNAYKNYKVFLNVNSVKDSPTMFSRRVFELMASGTIVISTYSKGIEEILGDDLVLFTESENDTKSLLEKLLTNDDYWSRLSVRGIRKVMEEHTYYHRLNYVFQQCKLMEIPSKTPSFTLLSRINNLQDLENLEHVLSRQTYQKYDIVLVFDNQSDVIQGEPNTRLWEVFNQQGQLSSFQNSLPGKKVTCVENFEGLDNLIVGDYLSIINPGDFYGENYLKDYALAAIYSDHWIYLGKHSFYKAFENDVIIQNSGQGFMYTLKVPTGTLAIKKEKLDLSKLPSLLKNDWFNGSEGDGSILSLDRYNYLQRMPNQPIGNDISSQVEI